MAEEALLTADLKFQRKIALTLQERIIALPQLDLESSATNLSPSGPSYQPILSEEAKLKLKRATALPLPILSFFGTNGANKWRILNQALGGNYLAATNASYMRRLCIFSYSKIEDAKIMLITLDSFISGDLGAHDVIKANEFSEADLTARLEHLLCVKQENETWERWMDLVVHIHYPFPLLEHGITIADLPDCPKDENTPTWRVLEKYCKLVSPAAIFIAYNCPFGYIDADHSIHRIRRLVEQSKWYEALDPIFFFFRTDFMFHDKSGLEIDQNAIKYDAEQHLLQLDTELKPPMAEYLRTSFCYAFPNTMEGPHFLVQVTDSYGKLYRHDHVATQLTTEQLQYVLRRSLSLFAIHSQLIRFNSVLQLLKSGYMHSTLGRLMKFLEDSINAVVSKSLDPQQQNRHTLPLPHTTSSGLLPISPSHLGLGQIERSLDPHAVSKVPSSLLPTQIESKSPSQWIVPSDSPIKGDWEARDKDGRTIAHRLASIARSPSDLLFLEILQANTPIRLSDPDKQGKSALQLFQENPYFASTPDVLDRLKALGWGIPPSMPSAAQNVDHLDIHVKRLHDVISKSTHHSAIDRHFQNEILGKELSEGDLGEIMRRESFHRRLKASSSELPDFVYTVMSHAVVAQVSALNRLWETRVMLKNHTNEDVSFKIENPTQIDQSVFFSCTYLKKDVKPTEVSVNDGQIQDTGPYATEGTLPPQASIPLIFSVVLFTHERFSRLIKVKVGHEDPILIALDIQPTKRAVLQNEPFWAVPQSEVYRLERLGKGSFGSVYRAAVRGLTCAMKYWEKETADFLAELTAIKELRHPNLIPVIGGCISPVASKEANSSLRTSADSVPSSSGMGSFILLKLGSDGDLYHYYRNEAVSLWELVKLAKDVACSMAYIHSQQCIHRDLKSLNVVIDNGIAYIIDLGMMRNASAVKNTKNRSGTRGWLAPEVMAYTPTYSFETDVFSFGVILYELATRKGPPDRTDEAVRRGEVPPLPSDFVTLHPEYNTLFNACTSPFSNLRPSFTKIVEDLDRIQARLPAPSLSPLDPSEPSGSFTVVSNDEKDSIFGPSTSGVW